MTPRAITITPGEHIEWHAFGLTFNGDTIAATVIAGAILLTLGFLVRRKASATKPTKLQLSFEAVTQEVERQVEQSLGIRTAPFVVPLALTLFLFLVIANLIAIIPTGHHPEHVPPPASDVNLTYALALLVIGTMHVVGIRKNGLRGYYGHLFRKPYVLIPLNIIEELVKPFTLALRLFGNIFAGTIMLALIAAMPVFVLWFPEVIWKLFDSAIGIIQAFIFGLLTVLYFGSVAPRKEGAH
ncbi:MAG: F0F1 ATP synthase subunit A [Actinomycetota bacterium]|nr:F0F1 ATP synthase subunit A [Actinomycetota bacterium]